MPRTPLHNCRARLQRLKDAKTFSGWVEDLRDGCVILRMKNPTLHELNDLYMIEIHGLDRSAQFKACLLEYTEDAVVLGIPEGIKFYAPRENARVYLKERPAQLELDGLPIPAMVEDVSKEGLGLIVQHQIPRSSLVSVKMESDGGSINLKAEVRYCKTDPDLIGSFRVGLLIKEMDRLSSARWVRFFELAA